MLTSDACYTDRFVDALAYFTKLHANQRRKHPALPYACHLWAVCTNAFEAGADEDVAIAALGHDAVEDQGGLDTLARIVEQFGARVGELIMAATDSTSVDPDRKLAWSDRKLDHIAHLVANTDPDVAILIASDKLHNLESMAANIATTEHPFDGYKGGALGTIWFFEQIRAALGDQFPAAFIARWDTALAALTTAARREPEPWTSEALRAALWAHLAGVHAAGHARSSTLDELIDAHHHEHHGTGGIRHHDPDSVHSDPHQVAHVLNELDD